MGTLARSQVSLFLCLEQTMLVPITYLHHPAFHPPNQLIFTFQAQLLLCLHASSASLRILIHNNPNYLWIILRTPHFDTLPHTYL